MNVVFILLVIGGLAFMIAYPIGVAIACGGAMGRLVAHGDPDRRADGRAAGIATTVAVAAGFWSAPLAAFCLSLPALIFVRLMEKVPPPRVPELPRARIAS